MENEKRSLETHLDNGGCESISCSNCVYLSTCISTPYGTYINKDDIDAFFPDAVSADGEVCGSYQNRNEDSPVCTPSITTSKDRVSDPTPTVKIMKATTANKKTNAVKLRAINKEIREVKRSIRTAIKNGLHGIDVLISDSVGDYLKDLGYDVVKFDLVWSHVSW